MKLSHRNILSRDNAINIQVHASLKNGWEGGGGGIKLVYVAI